MRVIIERDPGKAGNALAERVKAAAKGIASCPVDIVDRVLPNGKTTDRPDLAYEREMASKRP